MNLKTKWHTAVYTQETEVKELLELKYKVKLVMMVKLNCQLDAIEHHL